MNRYYPAILVSVLLGLCLVMDSYGQEDLKSNHGSENILLPDGTTLDVWKPETVYTKTYFVSQQDPNASDDNPGTESRPFKSIGQAARVLAPGEKVIVKEGVYREWVKPLNGGESVKKMIAYEAAPGDKVIIKGSEVIDPSSWQRNEVKSLGPLRRFITIPKDTSFKVWSARLPRKWFDGYNPFGMINRAQLAQEVIRRANPESIHSFTIEDLETTLLKRGLIFQNGRRLKQVSHTGYMYKEEGTYWVESDGLEIYIRPFGDIDPRQAVFEVTTREYLFAPERYNLGFIKVSGFQMQHAGNGWPLWPSGALSTRGGNHWLIENNKVSQVNAIGVDMGGHSESIEYKDIPEYNIVRGNEISDCGISGLAGRDVRFSLVEKNEVHDCAWHRIEWNFENAGIKLHHTRSTVVRQNEVYRITEGSGIWFDAQVNNSRITQNLIYNVETIFGGIFIELSRYTPTMIDNNILLNIDGNAIYEHDSDRLLIANNLISGCSAVGIMMNRGEAERMDELRGSTGRKHRVFNNIITDSNAFIEFDNEDNFSDYNLFGSNLKPGPLIIRRNEDFLDLNTWREFYHFDEHSLQTNIKIQFNESTRELQYEIEGQLPSSMDHPLIIFDYLDRKRNRHHMTPGPFSMLKTGETTTINLK